MRSRYSAYARGDADYLFRTWHSRTRPADVMPAPGITWMGLEVTTIVAGGTDAQSLVRPHVRPFRGVRRRRLHVRSIGTGVG